MLLPAQVRPQGGNRPAIYLYPGWQRWGWKTWHRLSHAAAPSSQISLRPAAGRRYRKCQGSGGLKVPFTEPQSCANVGTTFSKAGGWHVCGTESTVRAGLVVENRVKGLVVQSCQTLCDPRDCNPPGCPVHGILQQGCWNGLSFLSPGDLPNPGIEPRSPALQADFLLINPKYIWTPLNHLKPMLVLCDHIRLWVQKEARAQCRTKFLFWFEKCTWYKEQHAKQRK